MHANHLHLSPFLRPTQSHASSTSTSSLEPVDISTHCVGTPHTVASSSSGSISLSLSFQETNVFLACPGSNPSTYLEQDEGGPPESGSIPPVYDPLNENFPDQSPSSISNPFIIAALEAQKKEGISPRTALRNSSLSMYSSAADLPASILRGSLLMKLAKPTKIKDISLRFYGKCKTGWLESEVSKEAFENSVLMSGPQFQDEVIVSSHTWDYKPTPETASVKSSIVTMDTASVVSTDLFGADVAHIHAAPNLTLPHGCTAVPGEVSFKTPINRADPGEKPGLDNLKPSISNLSHNNIPFFTPDYFAEPSTDQGKHTFSTSSSTTMYPAGEYVFHFTLAIDARTAETIVCPNGAIKYYMVAKVERASRFSFSITGHREVVLVRSPPNIGEMISNAPLAISRDWENSLHYEISCDKKYIPLGTAIPISIKLTPIEKVRVHRVRIMVVESVTYLSAQVASMRHQDPVRRVMLFQKCAGSDAEDKEKPDRSEKGKKKSKIAMMASSLLHFTEEDTGDADGPRKIPDTTSLDITLPFVTADGDWDGQAKHHFSALPTDSKYFRFLRPDAIFNPFIHVKHRLHISFRISRLDSVTGKWRYFEVLIDTPIHFLSRQCKAESVELPRYADMAWNPQPEREAEPEDAAEYDDDVGPLHSISRAIPIRGKRDDMLSPVVRALSSPFSTSPPIERLSLLSLEDPLSAQLPSFDDALTHPLLGEAALQTAELSRQGTRSGDSDTVSVSSSSITESLTGSQGSANLPPQYERVDSHPSSRTSPERTSPELSLLPTVRHRPQCSPQDEEPLESDFTTLNRFGDLQGSHF